MVLEDNTNFTLTTGYVLSKITREVCEFIMTVWLQVPKYRFLPGPYFPVFGVNTEIYGVNLRIQTEYGKVRTRNPPYLNTFHAVQLHISLMFLID